MQPKNAITSTTAQSFIDSVIKPFTVSVKGKSYNYLDYISLPVAIRCNDEADVVDLRFTEVVLEWLGFFKAEGHYKYNTFAKTTAGDSQRPDFITTAGVGTAFVWEDKNTSEDFNEEHSGQIKRYTAGTTGYAVWSNARKIVGLRFDAKGEHHELVEVDVHLLAEIAATTTAVNEEQIKIQEQALELFKVLFSRGRFTDFESLLSKICVDENTFLRQAKVLTGTSEHTEFISGARQSLEHLRLSALLSITLALKSQEDIPEKESNLRKEWSAKKKQLIDYNLSAAVSLEKKQALSNAIDNVEMKLGVMSETELITMKIEEILKPKEGRLSATNRSAIQDWLKSAKVINSALRKIRLESVESRRIADAYQLWSELQPLENLVSPNIFAEQVAYVIFVRLLLARVLEDKGLLDHRIVSDGGLTAWREVVTRYVGQGISTIHSDSFLILLNESISRFYRHFFQQPVFDWFKPDDYLLVETLEFLNRYNFKYIESDLLGFTYEEYIERVARNKKGHFLTRPEVVDYMLDLAGYDGTDVIGRRFLDPSCGSGSFLVHGLRRHLKALITAICKQKGTSVGEAFSQDEIRKEIAQQSLDAAINLFYGMDIDPFACYLAELNILIQLIEDLHYLWMKGISCSIERFHIYTTDSLALPTSVLTSTCEAIGSHDFPRDIAEDVIDESLVIKAKSGDYASGFYYIIANPPYINRRQETFETDYASFPFFREALSGDTNTYLLFMRLGMHYMAQGGTLCFIVPLTVIGDISSKSIRGLFTSKDFSPNAITRFYTGNVLFPGIDQATAIICVKQQPIETICVAGGETVIEAKAASIQVPKSKVIGAYRPDMNSQPWLVSPDSHAYTTWEHAQKFPGRLSILIEKYFETRQGDVNATHANPFRTGLPYTKDSETVPLFKGQSISRFSPLPTIPEDTLRAKDGSIKLTSNSSRVNQELHRLLSLSYPENGIVIRQVARLNTRYELIATYFNRQPEQIFAFENSLWRFLAKPNVSVSSVDAFLGLVCSRTVAFLLNLFSTNNHVAIEELSAVPIPEFSSFPEKNLADLSRNCLDCRREVDFNFLQKYKMDIPEPGHDLILPPDSVLLQSSTPLISCQDAILKGQIEVSGSGKTGTLLRTGKIKFLGQSDFNQCAQMLFKIAEDMSWVEAVSKIHLPDPAAASHWLSFYEKTSLDASKLWSDFLHIQAEIDEVMFNWYQFDDETQQSIIKGLPWATRQT